MAKRKLKKNDRMICANEADRERVYKNFVKAGIVCGKRYTEDGKPCVNVEEDEK